MKKLLLVLVVLLMSTFAFAADTLTTFGNMESTFVYSGMRCVWGWKMGTPQRWAPSDSIWFYSPMYGLRLKGSPPNLSGTFTALQMPSVHGPGTYLVHLNFRVKRANQNVGLTFRSWTQIRGFCTDSGGIALWQVTQTYTLPIDTMWNLVSRDLMTIQLGVGDSLRNDDTLTLFMPAPTSYDTLSLDDVFLTGEFTPNGVEEGPMKPKIAAPVHWIRPGIYDLLGRRVEQMEHSGIYFVVRTDGSRKKIVHIR